MPKGRPQKRDGVLCEGTSTYSRSSNLYLQLSRPLNGRKQNSFTLRGWNAAKRSHLWKNTTKQKTQQSTLNSPVILQKWGRPFAVCGKWSGFESAL